MMKEASSFIILSTLLLTASGQYTADWTSLDARPLPIWYDQAKVGIFIHWGVFSVPSFGSEWFWHSWKDSLNNARYEEFMTKNYKPGFTYQDFASQFTAEFFNATEWADIFHNSGAKYIVLTSKHHEGFTLWPSKFSFSWNAKEVGPHRDLVGELASAIRDNTDLKFGLYHSLYEWYNTLWMQDKANNFTTNYFAHGKILPEMKELIETYKPEVLWSDGEWEAADWYWNSTLFLQWLYNSSPVKNTVVTNDRWGHETLCKHGGFYTCADRYNPGVLQSHKWENCLTIDKESWGFRRDAKFTDYMTFEELIRELVTTVSCGGNILINVGPTKEGIITPIYEERLRQLGEWLEVNGEAIYSSQPWTYQNETVTPGVWYTKSSGNVYASVLQWPEGGLLALNLPEIGPNNQVSILGYNGPVKSASKSSRGITIMLPDFSKVKRSLPWVIKLTNVLN